MIQYTANLRTLSTLVCEFREEMKEKSRAGAEEDILTSRTQATLLL